MVELLQQSLCSGAKASYVLFDSWFSFPVTIKKVYDQSIHLICMYYEYEGQKLTLNALYKAVRKKCGRAKILVSIIVSLDSNEQGQEVKTKALFIRDRRHKKKWLRYCPQIWICL